MKANILLQMLFIFPLIGLALVARSAWVKVLAFLAGIGMSSACNAGDSKPRVESNDPKPLVETGNSQPEVECYKQVAVTPAIMQDPRWAHSDLIADWAMAERAVLAIEVKGNIVYDELELRITAARQAATAAKEVVGAKLLSQAAYDMAVEVMSEWHADIALGSGGVKCYKRMPTPPIIDNSSARLLTLGRLQAEGRLSAEALAEARQGLKSTFAQEMSAKASAEVTDFLLDLLGLKP